VPDTVRLYFADGSTHRIDVDAGEGDATVEQIATQAGDYAKGWITNDKGRLLNLRAIVSIDLHRESDEGPVFRWLS
jgi:hypothetical protein